MKFSANLGFLWTDRSLPDAIYAAKAAGFDAVECHWPYDTPTGLVRSALQDTGLNMLGLNTRRGKPGENGLSALMGREAEARVAIDEAVEYAIAIGTTRIHVMAGFSAGDAARATFVSNLTYACAETLPHGITILIEPLNRHDAPNYFLTTTDQAQDIIQRVGAPNLKLMFDCYHVQRSEGDVSHRIKQLLQMIGHIQFASVPDRGPPDHGELNYATVFQMIADLNYDAPLGAEYKPIGPTDDSLGWLMNIREVNALKYR